MEGIQKIAPEEIEKESFRIIARELGQRGISVPEELRPVIFRVIHATADLEYAETLVFSENVIQKAKELIKRGICIVTDTNMTLSGINRKALNRFSVETVCFMADEDVAKEAKERGITRASVSMERAAALSKPVIIAAGNAPTALITLYEEMEKGFRPELIIGVPVGFVNVIPAKELILKSRVPYIVNRGRKGGSTVAAAIVNALLYEADPDRGEMR